MTRQHDLNLHPDTKNRDWESPTIRDYDVKKVTENSLGGLPSSDMVIYS